MDYEVLDSEKDLTKWKEALSLLHENLQDIYFYPEYVGMHRFIKGTKALMFIYQEGKNVWLYPFLLQPIDSKKFPLNGGFYFDIETAYGYGGPLTNCKDQVFLFSANDQFTGWCKEINVVAEFIRFHPLINNQDWIDQKVAIEFDRETVSLNLENLDIDNPPFNGKVRNIIKRAGKANVKVDLYDADKYFNEFIRLYYATLERIDADVYYLFNDEYFSELSKLVKNYGYLVGATLDGVWVGTALFLKGKRILHYHLSATDPDNRIPGVTNVLIFKAIELGVSESLDALHLGGGNSGDPKDSLLKFKKKMGNNVNKFYIGKRIHDNDIYFQLKNRWELNYPDLKENFNNRFLCYRFISQ